MASVTPEICSWRGGKTWVYSITFDEALSEHTEPEWFDSTWVDLYTYKIREQHDPPGQITRTTTHKLVLPIFFFVVSFLYRRFVVKRWRG